MTDRCHRISGLMSLAMLCLLCVYASIICESRSGTAQSAPPKYSELHCIHQRQAVRLLGVAEAPLKSKSWRQRNMEITIESRHLQDVVVVVPGVFTDARGFFSETFRADQFELLGLPTEFVQDNHSCSTQGVIRGLHYQWDPPMGKLMRVTLGSAYLVAVDIRSQSPTLGKWVGIECSAANRRMVWAPAGFARGFCALSNATQIQYKCTAVYNGNAEGSIRWNDPGIGIDWPLKNVVISEKDSKAPTLAEWLASPEADHFRYCQEPAADFALRR